MWEIKRVMFHNWKFDEESTRWLEKHVSENWEPIGIVPDDNYSYLILRRIKQ